jgi:hypothetical protein
MRLHGVCAKKKAQGQIYLYFICTHTHTHTHRNAPEFILNYMQPLFQFSYGFSLTLVIYHIRTDVIWQSLLFGAESTFVSYVIYSVFIRLKYTLLHYWIQRNGWYNFMGNIRTALLCGLLVPRVTRVPNSSTASYFLFALCSFGTSYKMWNLKYESRCFVSNAFFFFFFFFFGTFMKTSLNW